MNAVTNPAPQTPLLSAIKPANFAALATLLAGWDDLTVVQRRDLTSALSSAGRMLNLPLAGIPCDIGWLNDRLFQQPPRAFGFGQQRFHNIMSGLRAVLRRAGLHAPETRGEAGLTPAWVALLDACDCEAHRAGLRGLARYAANAGMEPTAVTDSVLSEFLTQDRQARLAAGVTHRGAITARAWNRAVAAAPALGARPLTAPAQRAPYTLPFTAYPESFQQEVRAFELSMSRPTGSAVFSTSEGGRRLRPATVKARLFSVRQAAAVLVLHGQDPASITGLRSLVDPPSQAACILDHFHQRAEARLPADQRGKSEVTGGQLTSIADTLLIVGRHHVGLAEESLTKLRQWRKQTLPKHQEGLGAKVRARLRRLIQQPTRSLLLTLPESIHRAAKTAAQVAPPGIDQARRMLLAMTLEILLVCPLRMGNLTTLRLDRHLLRLGPGGRRLTHLMLDAGETKNHAPIEWPLPPETARLLDEWLQVWRPLLGRDAASPFLFPGRAAGTPISQNGLGNALSKLIHAELGVPIHPHLLRHFAAWRHLNRHPGEYEIVRRALSHKSVETTIGTYCGLETEAAARHFDRGLEQDRREARHVVAALSRGRQRSAARGRR